MANWRKSVNWPRFIVSIAICQLTGLLGLLFTSSIKTWYNVINKPSFTPPAEIFAPVWTVLYFLMGISLYLVLNKRGVLEDARTALLMFGVQLALNAFWTISFFGLLSPFLAFTVCISILIVLSYTIYLFYKISKIAAYLLIPYLIWTIFATILNYYVWVLNAF